MKHDAAIIAALRTRVGQLTDELDELRETVRQLRAVQFNSEWIPPPAIKLTPYEARIVGCLMGRETFCSFDLLMMALYSDRSSGEMPLDKIVPTFVCKARAKLVPWGIEIRNVWGRGYVMPPDSRERLRALEAEAA